MVLWYVHMYLHMDLLRSRTKKGGEIERENAHYFWELLIGQEFSVISFVCLFLREGGREKERNINVGDIHR